MVSHLGGDEGAVSHKREVNARIWNLDQSQLLTKKVVLTRFVWNSFKSTFRAPSNLELSRMDFNFHFLNPSSPQGCSDRGENLCDDSVQVGVRRSLDTEALLGEIVDGLVVDQEGAVAVLQGCVRVQHGVVGFYD